MIDSHHANRVEQYTNIGNHFVCLLFSSSIFFAWFHAGYGNITPRTPLGKSITIFYAIIGMPLFLLYLSNIGDVFAKSFKFIYAKVCLCRICPGVAKRRESRNRRKMRAMQRQLNEDYDENVSKTFSKKKFERKKNKNKLFDKQCTTLLVLYEFFSILPVFFPSCKTFPFVLLLFFFGRRKTIYLMMKAFQWHHHKVHRQAQKHRKAKWNPTKRRHHRLPIVPQKTWAPSQFQLVCA